MDASGKHFNYKGSKFGFHKNLASGIKWWICTKWTCLYSNLFHSTKYIEYDRRVKYSIFIIKFWNNTYVLTYIHRPTYIYINTYINTYVYINTYIHIHQYIHICIIIYIIVNIYTGWSSFNKFKISRLSDEVICISSCWLASSSSSVSAKYSGEWGGIRNFCGWVLEIRIRSWDLGTL